MLKIGRIVNTHGIKGEVRVISDFKYKDDVFKEGNIIYIDGKKYIIKSYRKHKNFDLIKLDGFDDINDVLFLKGKGVFISRDDYVFSGILNEDLYGKKVYDKNKYIGVLEEIINNNGQELLVIKNDSKNILVPYVDEFVESIDLDIRLNLIEGFYED
ncbi:MAG: 16S rRNA processing protein RimM [Bacilli bacterium]|nr:16S rRNA processing protein RimM [Bacilli bacterium]